MGTKLYMFGRTPDSHIAVGRSIGFDGQYDTTSLIENERCLGTRLDLWECTNIPEDKRIEIMKGLRKEGYEVGMVSKVGAKPYREIHVSDDSVDAKEVKKKLDNHPGRVKGRAAVEALKQPTLSKQERKKESV